MIGLVMLLAAESATFLQGDELYALCKGDKTEKLQCLRYVEGAADGIAVAQWADKQNVRRVCVPTKATIKKLASVTVKYINKHPAERHLQGSILVWNAFSQAYPCSKK
ncbi:hypothetical protein BH10PSE15_BH10PSE15_01710 [soil metagenome]